VIREFETETGIKVNYSVFDSNDVAETTLSAGQSGFDLVTVNVVPHLGRQIPKGLWQPIDRGRIPNAGNADPRLLELMQHVDPGNRYAIPYMWGTIGLIYNRKAVAARLADAPLDSLDMVLRAEVVRHFADCGVSVLSSWVDMMPLLSSYVGQRGLPTDPGAIHLVSAAFGRVRPMIRRITTSGYYDQLARGELCLAIGYSADAMVARRRAEELQNGVDIGFSQPREAVPLYIDAYAIPTTARHVDAALRFIDFTLRPEVGAELARATGFAVANPAAVARLEPALRNNPIVYPADDVRARFTLGRAYTMEETRFLSRTWLRMRTGH
jgi:putrescine transport system substrate-binding protein